MIIFRPAICQGVTGYILRQYTTIYIETNANELNIFTKSPLTPLYQRGGKRGRLFFKEGEEERMALFQRRGRRKDGSLSKRGILEGTPIIPPLAKGGEGGFKEGISHRKLGRTLCQTGERKVSPFGKGG